MMNDVEARRIKIIEIINNKKKEEEEEKEKEEKAKGTADRPTKYK